MPHDMALTTLHPLRHGKHWECKYNLQQCYIGILHANIAWLAFSCAAKQQKGGAQKLTRGTTTTYLQAHILSHESLVVYVSCGRRQAYALMHILVWVLQAYQACDMA